jgi:hypothetical protein
MFDTRITQVNVSFSKHSQAQGLPELDKKLKECGLKLGEQAYVRQKLREYRVEPTT